MSPGEAPRAATVNEYRDTLRAWLAHLAADDPGRRRFGARHHDYALRPPLEPDRLEAIERELDLRLPESYRRHLLDVGDGGAGPYHGMMPLDHPLQLELARDTFPLSRPVTGTGPVELRGRGLYRGAIGLGHVGCNYFALLVVRGPAAGQVWIDQRCAASGVAPIHTDFAAYYRTWVASAADNRLPPSWIAPGRCALADALSRYLAGYEHAHGIGVGQLGGESLRMALAAIGDGAIRVAATDPDAVFFDPGDLVSACASCELMIENLVPRGLRRDQLARGREPYPMR